MYNHVGLWLQDISSSPLYTHTCVHIHIFMARSTLKYLTEDQAGVYMKAWSTASSTRSGPPGTVTHTRRPRNLGKGAEAQVSRGSSLVKQSKTPNSKKAISLMYSPMTCHGTQVHGNLCPPPLPASPGSPAANSMLHSQQTTQVSGNLELI